MRITINKILDNSIVYANTKYGVLSLKWQGELPLVNHEYDVEFDINETLYWNKDIVLSQTEDYLIKSRDNSISLYGVLESIDSDGYTVLRIDNNIVTFIAKGVAFKVGSKIEVCVDSITAYPFDYY